MVSLDIRNRKNGNPHQARKDEKSCREYNDKFLFNIGTCPEVKGTFISTSSSFKLEMVDDINIKGDWLTNSRPQFSGEFLRGCHGKLMFNDDKAYSFDYNTKTCTLTMDNGEVLTKKNCEKGLLFLFSYAYFTSNEKIWVALY